MVREVQLVICDLMEKGSVTGAQDSLDMCVKCFVEFNQSILSAQIQAILNCTGFMLRPQGGK